MKKQWWYWEICNNTQLQTIAVQADTQEEAVSIFTKRAGKNISDKINLTDFPLILSEGMGLLVERLLSRFTLDERKNGEIRRMYKCTPSHMILILGTYEGIIPQEKANLGKLLS